MYHKKSPPPKKKLTQAAKKKKLCHSKYEYINKNVIDMVQNDLNSNSVFFQFRLLDDTFSESVHISDFLDFSDEMQKRVIGAAVCDTSGEILRERIQYT
jgi:hypothetical protein